MLHKGKVESSMVKDIAGIAQLPSQWFSCGL